VVLVVVVTAMVVTRSPRMLSNSINEGSKCVSITWRRGDSPMVRSLCSLHHAYTSSIDIVE